MLGLLPFVALLALVGVAALYEHVWRSHGRHRATDTHTIAPVVVSDSFLPATPVFAPIHALAQEGRIVELRTIAHKAQEEAMIRSFDRARRVRSHLNRRLAAYLNACGITPEGEAWARARRSHVALFVGTEFIGDWDTLDDAHTALLGLDAEAREEFLLCGDVRLPRNEAELELMRSLAHTTVFEDEYWPTLTDALESRRADNERAEAIVERALVLSGVDVSDALAALEARVQVVQPVISSTERMRTLRDERKRAGLTTRGTIPLPLCGAPTRKGTACKRKAQDNGRCDWHQAHVSVTA